MRWAGVPHGNYRCNAHTHTHKLLEKNDYVGGDTRRDLPILAENNEEEPRDINANPGLFGNATYFLDPKNWPLDLLTPDAKQNRRSYLVELLLDKFRKRICNEALKTRLRKDSAAFGVADMPTNIRSIGKFLRSITLQKVTRHRCGNDECSHAWIGSVDPFQFDSNDCCLDWGTLRCQGEFYTILAQLRRLRLCKDILSLEKIGGKKWTSPWTIIDFSKMPRG